MVWEQTLYIKGPKSRDVKKKKIRKKEKSLQMEGVT